MEEAETRVAATEKAEALITKANVIEEEALEAVTVIELAKIEAEMLKTEAKAIIEADVIETGAAHTTASVNSTVIELIERALQEELQHIAKVEDANLIDTQNSEIIGQNQENISDL
jgi:ribosomal protein L3